MWWPQNLFLRQDSGINGSISTFTHYELQYHTVNESLSNHCFVPKAKCLRSRFTGSHYFLEHTHYKFWHKYCVAEYLNSFFHPLFDGESIQFPQLLMQHIKRLFCSQKKWWKRKYTSRKSHHLKANADKNWWNPLLFNSIDFLYSVLFNTDE